MFDIIQNVHFQAGFALAAIVLAAAIMSPALRAAALGLLAVAGLWLVMRHGPDGAATVVGVLRWKLSAKPQFVQGLVAGAVITTVIFLSLKQGGKRQQ